MSFIFKYPKYDYLLYTSSRYSRKYFYGYALGSFVPSDRANEIQGSSSRSWHTHVFNHLDIVSQSISRWPRPQARVPLAAFDFHIESSDELLRLASTLPMVLGCFLLKRWNIRKGLGQRIET